MSASINAALDELSAALMEADTNYDGDLTLEEFDELVEDRPDVVR